MVYRIQINQIGKGGLPAGRLALYEAGTEMEAVAIATYEIDINRPAQPRIATVFDPAGQLVLAYVGRATGTAGHAGR